MLCYEAFGNLDVFDDDHNSVLNLTQDHPELQPYDIKSSHSSPKKSSQPCKRSKKYNALIIRTSCSSYEEYTLRLKLTKKIMNAKMHDLLKMDSCFPGIRLENTLMATLPPINEIDMKLHEKLISVMEQRIQDESKSLNVTLPGMIDTIKLDWYQNMHNQQNPDLTVYVPETDYDEM